MAITTYAELKTAVALWLDRSDLSAVIPDFIALAEAAANRRFANKPLRPMEERATATLDSEFLTLPADPALFISVKSLAVVGSDGQENRLRAGRSDATAFDYRVGGDTLDTPDSYSLTAGQFRFSPKPATGARFTAVLTYWQRIPSLSDALSSNWLLAAHPDVYLFGSLAHAVGFIDDPRQLAQWESRFLGALEQVAASYPERGDETPLAVRDMPMRRAGYDRMSR